MTHYPAVSHAFAGPLLSLKPICLQVYLSELECFCVVGDSLEMIGTSNVISDLF